MKNFPWFYFFFALIWIIAIIPLFINSLEPSLWTWRTLSRYTGMVGFALVYLSLMGAYIKEWQYHQTKKPFMTSHHLLVIPAWILMLIHPVVLAIQWSNWGLFIPNNFDSLMSFLRFGGKVALIIFTIGVIAVALRKVLKGWKIIHMFQLIAFLLAGFHAWLIGTDTQSIGVRILLILMMSSAAAFFFYNRKRFKYVLRK